MVDPLEPLLADGVIEEVVSRLKSGKEADVWLVRHAGEIVTAKVYRERDTRSFKNNAAYTEGRRVRNTRTQRAIDRGTRFGQAAAEEAWKSKEADALYRLHAAGVRVPRPVMFYEGVLLMEVVVDAEGHPAPRLVDAPLPPDQAGALYADLRKQVVAMLCCDLVHGDLSPFNVLVAWNGPVVIDFPQVVDAAHNRQAEGFLARDLRNIHRFCAGLDPSLRAADGDAAEIWRAYARRELSPDFVPTGRAAPRVQGGRPGRADSPKLGDRPRGGPERAAGRPGGGPSHPHPPAQGHGAHGAHSQGGHAHARSDAGHPPARGPGGAPQRGPGGQPQRGPGGQQQRGPGGPAQPGGGRGAGRGGPTGERPGGGGQRPMPEVVRVARPLRGGTAPGSSTPPGAPVRSQGHGRGGHGGHGGGHGGHGGGHGGHGGGHGGHGGGHGGHGGGHG